MKLEELQCCKCTPQVHIPFSTCWSDDNYIAMATEKGIYTAGGRWQWKAKHLLGWNLVAVTTILLVCSLNGGASASDITSAVFGGMTSGFPAAFGDFNSDEYPDLFMIGKDRRNIEILLGGDGDPLIKKSASSRKCRMDFPVTSLVPGDFDGDAVMDVLVTMDRQNASAGCSRPQDTQEVRVLWGDGDSLNCSSRFSHPLFMCGQPLAMDYNQDMIIDLFGELHSKRTFWVFDKTRNSPKVVGMVRSSDAEPKGLSPLRIPHSHAFLDLSSDYSPDMFVTTQAGFEIWLKDPNTPEGFVYSAETWKFPDGVKYPGQSIFLDTELKGKLDHIFPACHDAACTNSSLYVRLNGKWLPLKINFHDKTNGVWGFIPPDPSSIIQNVITLHGGDYNMDGYPDLLATLKSGTKTKTFLLKNEQCVADCAEYSRTFTIAWDELSPANNNTQLGVFYDFMQDGILDIIFVKDGNTTAFKNNLDYDANFIKVMVITGIKEHPVPVIPNPSRKKTYGTNLPGPLISYNSTDQDDKPRASASPQLPQSAYMSLHLPYTLFGLGRTPNFVDKLTVGLYNKTRYWTQIIPNSQMVVIPIPLNDPSHWTARLFVTPSKLIVKSFIALLGTCLFLTLIIAVLWWRERREDHQEKREGSHLFHYDGM